MTDLTPEFDFAAASRQAEQEARDALPADPGDTDGETTHEATASQQEERPRGSDGRFVARPDEETPAEPADTVPPVEDETSTEAEQPLLAGKYKTVADLEHAYQEAQRRLGEQGSEIGELRQLREEFAQLRQEITPAAPQYDAEAVQALLDENPAQIMPTIQQAWQTGNRPLLYQSIATLAQYDAAKAEELRIAVATEDAKAGLQQQIAPIVNQNAQSRWEKFVADTPGVDQFIQSEEIARAALDFPAIAELAAHGNPDQQLEAIKTLYLASRGRASDTLAADVQQVARAQAHEARAAAEEAYVASTTTATATETEKLSLEERIAAGFEARVRARNDSYLEGWERKPSK